jgi:hypothetical protein
LREKEKHHKIGREKLKLKSRQQLAEQLSYILLTLEAMATQKQKKKGECR